MILNVVYRSDKMLNIIGHFQESMTFKDIFPMGDPVLGNLWGTCWDFLGGSLQLWPFTSYKYL